MHLDNLLEKIDSLETIEKAYIYDKERKSNLKNEHQTVKKGEYTFNIFTSKDKHDYRAHSTARRSERRTGSTIAAHLGLDNIDDEVNEADIQRILRLGLSQIVDGSSSPEDVVGAYGIFSILSDGAIIVIIGKDSKDLPAAKNHPNKFIAHVKTFFRRDMIGDHHRNYDADDFMTEITIRMNDLLAKQDGKLLDTNFYIVESKSRVRIIKF